MGACARIIVTAVLLDLHKRLKRTKPAEAATVPPVCELVGVSRSHIVAHPLVLPVASAVLHTAARAAINAAVHTAMHSAIHIVVFVVFVTGTWMPLCLPSCGDISRFVVRGPWATPCAYGGASHSKQHSR